MINSTRFIITILTLFQFIYIFSQATGTGVDDLEYKKYDNKLRYLNPTNFNDNIKKGNWLVFFGSSLCGHCRQFTPAWSLAQDYLDFNILHRKIDVSPDAGGPLGTGNGLGGDHHVLGMAKIECSRRNENEDLCAEQGIEGYPTIIAFEDGVKLYEKDFRVYNEKKFSVASSVDLLSDFIYTTNKLGAIPKFEDKYFSHKEDDVKQEVKADVTPEKGAPLKGPLTNFEDSSSDNVVNDKKNLKLKSASEISDITSISEEIDKIYSKILQLSDIESNHAVTANPEGQVVTLTTSNFDDLTSEGPWLLEFYAPWCPHCKLFAPIYEEIAAELKGKVNIGKIDGTQEPGLMKRFKVSSFPNIKFYQKRIDDSEESEIADYHGLRTKEEVINFATYLISRSSYKPMLYSELNDYFKNVETSFVLYVGGDQSDYDTKKQFNIPVYNQELEETIKLVAKNHAKKRRQASLFVVPDPSAYKALIGLWKDTNVKTDSILDKTNAILLAIKDNGKTVLPYLGSFEDEVELPKFLSENSYDRAFELDQRTQKDTMESDGYVVLYALDRLDELFDSQLAGLKLASIEFWKARIKEEKSNQLNVLFTWIDSRKWEHYLSRVFQIHDHDIPKLIIAHPAINTYYDATIDGSPLAVSNIIWNLNNIKFLTPRKTSSIFTTVVFNIANAFISVASWVLEKILFIILILALFAVYLWYRNRSVGSAGYQSIGMGPRAGRFKANPGNELGLPPTSQAAPAPTAIFDAGLFGIGSQQKAD